MPDPEPTEELVEAVVEFTIDELAAHTRVPSRTIRFYQSQGALPSPEIRGRKAFYTEAHVERLELIGLLQERGLQIKAIRDLTQRFDRGELNPDEWLGLQDKLHQPWSDDRPRIFTRAELQELAGAERRHIAADLVRVGLIAPQGDGFLVQSPALLSVYLKMEQAGIDLDVAKGGVDLARYHLAKLASALLEHLVRRAGDGFGRSGTAGELTGSFDAALPLGRALVDIVFAQELEAVTRELVASGRLAKVAATKRS